MNNSYRKLSKSGYYPEGVSQSDFGFAWKCSVCDARISSTLPASVDRFIRDGVPDNMCMHYVTRKGSVLDTYIPPIPDGEELIDYE